MEIINKVFKVTDNTSFVECERCGWDGLITDLQLEVYGKNKWYVCCPECQSTKVNSY